MSLAQKILNLSRSLLPTGRAFKMPFAGTFEKMMNGIQSSEVRAWEDMISIFDSIFPDNSNFTTQDAADWERRLGIATNEETDLEDRKLAIKRKMNHPGTILGRQHYLYLQGQLQAAGFDVYVHPNKFGDYAVDPDDLGVYVAVGQVGKIMTSPDGLNWTTRTSPANNSWTGVIHGNDLFVAVSTGASPNSIATSPNGIDWDLVSDPVSNNWSDIAYGNNVFSVVSVTVTGQRVMYSSDGITWLSAVPPGTNRWRRVYFGNNLFVAVADSGTGNRVMTSSNGSSWTLRTSAADYSWFGVTYGNGLFVAVATNGFPTQVMTSPDGITWTLRTTPGPFSQSWRNVVYGNGLFVAVSSSGSIGNRVMTSPDGITWTLRSAPDAAWFDIEFNNGLFVAVSGDSADFPTQVMTSPDGITWTLRNASSDAVWSGITTRKVSNGYTIIANHIDESLDSSFVVYDPYSFKATFFVGGENFGERADVAAERKTEFRQLLLRLKPVQTVGFLLIDYV